MNRLPLLAVVLSLLICAAHTASAAPVWGTNCLSCHNQLHSHMLYVLGDTVADPDESATGAPDHGLLPTFRARPGQTETLLVELVGLEPDDLYAVELKRLRFPGVETGGELDHNPDCNWAQWVNPGNHYTDPAVSYRWGAGPTTFAFEIDVIPTSDVDYYDLVFAVAGKRHDGGDLFCSMEHFYLRPSWIMPGDLDEDGDIDLTDYAAFVQCVAGPGNTTPPLACQQQIFDASDFDGDGDVDFRDFGGFQRAFAP